MGDIGLFKQGWKWLQSQKQAIMGTHIAMGCIRDTLVCLVDRHWPVVYRWCVELGRFLLMTLFQWRDCVVRGFWSLLGLGSTTLFVILWSCFLSLTSTSCLIYVLLILGTSGATIRYLGYTPGLFIVGLFGILIMWKYGNFWITGLLFLVGGYTFSLNRARLLIFMSTAYSVYCVYVRAGWCGVFLSINLAFMSNDLFNIFLQGYDRMSEGTQFEECKDSEPVVEDFPTDTDFSSTTGEPESFAPNKSSCNVPSASNTVYVQKDSSSSNGIKVDSYSVNEMKRIINSSNHYEVVGFPRNKDIDRDILRKEYLKKAMLVHPDKNMGNPLASESFKKLQCANEVLSDLTKKRNYDELLRKEESMSVCQKQRGTSQQSRDGVDYRSEESRKIECIKCGNTHIWICTNRSKMKARWCQDCCQYHQAKDGDGWVEYRRPAIFSTPQKVEIPRAFVCAESKIFDVSEWAICQGMECKANTHRPSFHVNMVGLDKTTTQRSNSSRFPWDLDAEMMTEDEEQFELWLQQALASGLFSETSKRRKSWSPFQKKVMKPWRRSP